jgi:hypothetical protein
MAQRVIAHLQDCEDGKCPTIFRDDVTGDVTVRGALPDGTEADVRIGAADWAYLAAQLPR